MGKVSKKIKLLNLETTVSEFFADFVKSSREDRDAALDAGANVLVDKLAAASPGNGDFKNSWEVATYKSGRKYVHNTKTVNIKGTGMEKPERRNKAKATEGKEKATHKTGIPLSNILEHSKSPYGKPFIRATADAAETEVFNAIKNKLNGG